MFSGQVHSLPATFLKDDGCETDAVFYKFLQRRGVTHLIEPDTKGREFQVADGRTATIGGSVTLTYRVGNFRERRTFAVITAPSPYDFILGMPFCRDNNPVMDYRARSMHIQRKNKNKVVEYHTLAAVPMDLTPRADATIRFIRVAEVKRAMRQRAQVFMVHVRPSAEYQQCDNDGTRTGASATSPETGPTAPTGELKTADGQGRVSRNDRAGGENQAPVCIFGANAVPSASEAEGNKKIFTPLDARLEDMLADYSALFEEPRGVINRAGYEHVIKLVDNASPPKKNAYRMTPRMLAELQRQLTELLDRGHIRPSCSPFGAPVLFVAKKDTDELRMCVDYRALNNLTVKDSYPIPRIDQLIDILHGAEVFTKLDLAAAYNQIPVKEECIPMTAFATRYGLFEYKVMPFGLCNAPATCMRYMQHVLRDYLDKFVIVYLDDVLIFSKREDHEEKVRLVLEKLLEVDLRLKRKKCVFGADSVEYLGHVISKDGVAMDPRKVKSILEWPRPKTVTDVRSFLGMVGYYRKFLKHFAEISAPLVELTKKGMPWSWDATQQYAFDALKEMLTDAPTLLIPDTSPGQSFVIHADASDFAVGAVLLQDQGQGLQPCGFYSKKMNRAEKNYSVGDKEMLAMKLALTEYRIYVEGVPTVLCTDHRNNINLLTRPAEEITSRRVARWVEYMQTFGKNLTLAYIKGEDNQADALSRRPDYKDDDGESDDESSDWDGDGDGDGETQQQPQGEKGGKAKKKPPLGFSSSATPDSDKNTSRKSNTPCSPATPLSVCSVAHLDRTRFVGCNALWTDPGRLERLIKAGYARDPDYRARPGGNPSDFVRDNSLTLLRGLWRHGTHRIAVPNDHSIRRALIKLAHNFQSHVGEAKTRATLAQRFWWPTLYRDVHSFVQECATCARAKTSTQKKYGELMPIIPRRRWDMLTMDIISGLVRDREYDGIFVVVDKYSKYIVAKPISLTEGTARIIGHLEREVIAPFGAPRVIICDQDTRFTSREFMAWAARKNIEVRYSTKYHPQTDGQTERANRTLEDLLRARLKDQVQFWRRALPLVVRDYNATKNATTGVSPYFVLYGRHPTTALDTCVPSGFPAVTLTPAAARAAVDPLVRQNIARAAEAQAKQYNKKRRDIEYEEGDKVYVETRYLPGRYNRVNKLENRREGPFRVVSKTNRNSYVVRLPNHDRPGTYLDVGLSVDKLMPYRESERWQLDQGRVRHNPHAEIVRATAHRRRGDAFPMQYYVEYRNHHPGLNQWVPELYVPEAVKRAYWASTRRAE